MSSTDASAARSKGVVYAEDTLEVHKVYQEAREADVDLVKIKDDLRFARANKRKLEADLADREIDLFTQEKLAHPDHSQAALDRHMKAVIRRDDKCKELRDEIGQAQDGILFLEDRSSDRERQVRMLTARMEQLGGLLNYYAALKKVSAIQKENRTEG